MNTYKDCAWIKQGSPLIIAVDFDDTLVEAGDKFPEIKKPTKLMTQLVELKNNPLYHIQLILWTCREDEYLDQAIEYCKKHGLTFDAVNEEAPATLKWKPKGRKPFAHIYIDDRGLSMEELNMPIRKVTKFDCLVSASNMGGQ